MSRSARLKADPYSSSDAARHARPLQHAQRVTLHGPLQLELGGISPGGGRGLRDLWPAQPRTAITRC